MASDREVVAEAGIVTFLMRRLVADILPSVIEWRRSIHHHPELAYEETRTAELVANHLRELGWVVRTGVAGTGVVADLENASGVRNVIALRADMDGLPVEEATGLPFASRRRTTWRGQEVPVMHACGHDAHVAILMGVASVLSSLRDRVERPVRLIFQPAEEIVPEGKNGAELMVGEGVLEGVEEIYGLHVTQSLPSGILGLRPGPLMASVDEFAIEVIGSQTHGAYPWRGIDPIVVASQIVLALQTIVSRRVDMTVSPAVVTVGSFHGGVRSNIISDRARLEGTIRSLDENVRSAVHERVREVAEGVAQAAGARALVEIRRGYPVTRNDSDRTRSCREILERSVGADQVTEVQAVFGGEDFAFFLEQVPGAFFFLGVRPPELSTSDAIPNHSPSFDVHEPALARGVEALASLATG